MSKNCANRGFSVYTPRRTAGEIIIQKCAHFAHFFIFDDFSCFSISRTGAKKNRVLAKNHFCTKCAKVVEILDIRFSKKWHFSHESHLAEKKVDKSVKFPLWPTRGGRGHAVSSHNLSEPEFRTKT